MAREEKTYVYPGHLSGGLAQRLGNSPWNNQAQIMGTFPSRKAFLDAVMAEGLVHARSVQAAGRYMASYGYEYEPRPGELEPGVIYVQGDLSREKPVKYADVKEAGQ